jgi:hypothetical protein
MDAIDRMPQFRVNSAGIREALLSNSRPGAKSTLGSPASIRRKITNWKWSFFRCL